MATILTNTQYPYLTGPVNSFDDLRLEKFKASPIQIVPVLYRSSLNDGYGGFFIWDNTSVASDNNTDIIIPNILNPSDPGRWIKLNMSSSGGSGGSQTLAQTLILGNTTSGTNIEISSGDGLVMDQQSTHPTFGSGKGVLWTKDDSPTTLYFTNSTGTDYLVSPIPNSFKVITPTIINSDQNNYDPTDWEPSTIVRLSSSTLVNLTGLVFSDPGVPSNKILINIGDFDIVLKNQDSSSVSSSRIIIPGGEDLVLEPNDSIEIFYDFSIFNWRVLKLEKDLEPSVPDLAYGHLTESIKLNNQIPFLRIPFQTLYDGRYIWCLKSNIFAITGQTNPYKFGLAKIDPLTNEYVENIDFGSGISDDPTNPDYSVIALCLVQTDTQMFIYGTDPGGTGFVVEVFKQTPGGPPTSFGPLVPLTSTPNVIFSAVWDNNNKKIWACDITGTNGVFSIDPATPQTIQSTVAGTTSISFNYLVYDSTVSRVFANASSTIYSIKDLNTLSPVIDTSINPAGSTSIFSLTSPAGSSLFAIDIGSQLIIKINKSLSSSINVSVAPGSPYGITSDNNNLFIALLDSAGEETSIEKYDFSLSFVGSSGPVSSTSVDVFGFGLATTMAVDGTNVWFPEQAISRFGAGDVYRIDESSLLVNLITVSNQLQFLPELGDRCQIMFSGAPSTINAWDGKHDTIMVTDITGSPTNTDVYIGMAPAGREICIIDENVAGSGVTITIHYPDFHTTSIQTIDIIENGGSVTLRSAELGMWSVINSFPEPISPTPTLTQVLTAGNNSGGNSIILDSSSNLIIKPFGSILGSDGVSSVGNYIFIKGGDGDTGFVGGDVIIRGGIAGGGTTGGNISISSGGTNGSISCNGGTVQINGASGLGTSRTGGSITLTSGNSTDALNGADISFQSGTSTGTGNGGNINITSGAGGTTSGDSGDINILGGTVTTSGNGGAIFITASNANGTSKTGGLIKIISGTSTDAVAGPNTIVQGGQGGPTGDGGETFINGGLGGSTSGNGGDVNIIGGVSLTSGNGGNARVLANNGIGTNKNGGNLYLGAGTKTGSGTDGTINLSGGASILTTSASAGALTIPVLAASYLIVIINSTTYKIPLFN